MKRASDKAATPPKLPITPSVLKEICEQLTPTDLFDVTFWAVCLAVVVPNIYIHNSWRKGKKLPFQVFLHSQGQGLANRQQSYLFASSTIHQHYATGHIASFTTSVLHQGVARNTLNIVTIMGCKLHLQDGLAWKTVTMLHFFSLALTFEFESHLNSGWPIWASDSQILLARGTSSVTKVFKFITNSWTQKWKSRTGMFECNKPVWKSHTSRTSHPLIGLAGRKRMVVGFLSGLHSQKCLDHAENLSSALSSSVFKMQICKGELALHWSLQMQTQQMTHL